MKSSGPVQLMSLSSNSSTLVSKLEVRKIDSHGSAIGISPVARDPKRVIRDQVGCARTVAIHGLKIQVSRSIKANCCDFTLVRIVETKGFINARSIGDLSYDT